MLMSLCFRFNALISWVLFIFAPQNSLSACSWPLFSWEKSDSQFGISQASPTGWNFWVASARVSPRQQCHLLSIYPILNLGRGCGGPWRTPSPVELWFWFCCCLIIINSTQTESGQVGELDPGNELDGLDSVVVEEKVFEVGKLDLEQVAGCRLYWLSMWKRSYLEWSRCTSMCWRRAGSRWALAHLLRTGHTLERACAQLVSK